MFAITTSGFRWGLRMSTAITALTVVLYLSLLLVSAEGVKFYVMRPVYLVVVGYLIGYLGHSRVRLEEDVRRLEADLVWLPPARPTSSGACSGGPPRCSAPARSRSPAMSRSACATPRSTRKLLITEVTVKKHLNEIFPKVGVRDRVELVLYANKLGLISAHERVA